MSTTRLTYDECWALIRKLVTLVNVQFHTLADGTALTTSGNNFTSLVSTFEQTKNQRIVDQASILQDMRLDAVSFLTRAREIYRILVLEMARSAQVNSSAGENFGRAFRDIWLYMHTNSKFVRRRVPSFGTPANVGSPVGTGVWYRNKKDWKGYDVNSPQADTVKAVCVADKTTGASSGREVFEFTSGAAGQDMLEQLGLGSTRLLTVASEETSILDEGGFENTLNTSGTTLVGSWGCTSAANFQLNGTTKYRGSYALQIDATDYISQDIRSIDRTRPVLAMVRWNRNGAAGTLQLTLGSKTASVVLAAQTGWADLYIDLDDDSWPDNWINSDPKFRIDWTKTSGSPLIDSCILRPMDEFNGIFHAITAGATDWAVTAGGDTISVTDSFTDAGVIQFWTKIFFGLYWPHRATGSYNLTDSS